MTSGLFWRLTAKSGLVDHIWPGKLSAVAESSLRCDLNLNSSDPEEYENIRLLS